ncbi:MAG: glycosyltransferase family 1 protein [Bacteroidaceae bacterium]|nr:glycosyltransferase family 1 protein [Bacteroidaceae bacterium]
MRILLIGEYSNVHWTLAEGLRTLGHEVTVVSDGDCWKDYPRDIDLRRRSLGWIDTARYLFDIQRTLPRLRDYDVVQLINPVFLDLRAERILPYYKRLRKQNDKLFLGSFGIDKPWVEEGLKPDTFRYSDFYLNGQRRLNPFTYQMEADWLRGSKGTLFDQIADDCDGIIASLYENLVCCRQHYADKLHFIPFPINLENITPKEEHPEYSGLRFFIGIQRDRSIYKGTDIMLRALERLQKTYPDRMEIVKAESVPFPTYQNMMNHSDILLDQLYSYTPGMNGLLAMAKGLVLVGGGEEEHYQSIGETELRPIINVCPSEDDVVAQIESRLLTHPDDIRQLSLDSVAYIRRHHDHIRIAQQFLKVWQGTSNTIPPSEQ